MNLCLCTPITGLALNYLRILYLSSSDNAEKLRDAYCITSVEGKSKNFVADCYVLENL